MQVHFSVDDFKRLDLSTRSPTLSRAIKKIDPFVGLQRGKTKDQTKEKRIEGLHAAYGTVSLREAKSKLGNNHA
jgi:hypothetical protein